MTIDLPKGITKTDCTRPGGKGKDAWKKYNDQMERGKNPNQWGGSDPHEYELWYTERFGWVMPTLLISRSRTNPTDRYYGVTVGPAGGVDSYIASKRKEQRKGNLVRVGNGPHVKARVTVYVRKTRLEKLQWLIDLYHQGMEDANDTRDRISTRRSRSTRRTFNW